SAMGTMIDTASTRRGSGLFQVSGGSIVGDRVWSANNDVAPSLPPGDGLLSCQPCSSIHCLRTVLSAGGLEDVRPGSGRRGRRGHRCILSDLPFHFPCTSAVFLPSLARGSSLLVPPRLLLPPAVTLQSLPGC